MEAPTYFVCTGMLEAAGVTTHGIPCDHEGMNVDFFEDYLNRLRQTGEIKRLKAIYTVSYCQNPGGWTLSLDRRRKLLSLIDELPAHVRIIEDRYYELCFDSKERPPLLHTFAHINPHLITM